MHFLSAFGFAHDISYRFPDCDDLPGTRIDRIDGQSHHFNTGVFLYLADHCPLKIVDPGHGQLIGYLNMGGTDQALPAVAVDRKIIHAVDLRKTLNGIPHCRRKLYIWRLTQNAGGGFPQGHDAVFHDQKRDCRTDPGFDRITGHHINDRRKKDGSRADRIIQRIDARSDQRL